MLVGALVFSCSDKSENGLENAKETSVKVKDAITVNSMQLLREYKNDRSTANDKYAGKVLLITDLLIRDVFIPKESFQKKMEAIPYDPKSQSAAIGYRGGVYTFNGNDLDYGDFSAVYFNISNEELKRLNLLSYEGVSGRNFEKKMDVYGVISEVNYTPNRNIENNTTAHSITFELEKVKVK